MKKMIVTLMLLLFIPVFYSLCSEPPGVIPGYEGTRLNPDILADIELARAHMNACIQGDREGMERYMHKNYSSTGTAGANTHFTREEIIEGWIDFAKGSDNIKFSNRIWYSWVVDEMEGNPDLVGKWVVTWCDFSYRTKADGREVSFPLHLALRIREEKVDSTIYYYDRLSMLSQLGYQLLPPKPADQ